MGNSDNDGSGEGGEDVYRDKAEPMLVSLSDLTQKITVSWYVIAGPLLVLPTLTGLLYPMTTALMELK